MKDYKICKKPLQIDDADYCQKRNIYKSDQLIGVELPKVNEK